MVCTSALQLRTFGFESGLRASDVEFACFPVLVWVTFLPHSQTHERSIEDPNLSIGVNVNVNGSLSVCALENGMDHMSCNEDKRDRKWIYGGM